jgi:serine/threonine protein kinase
MLVMENNKLNVWWQKRLLGSGSSAEVYEYKDNLNNSRVIKFFRSNFVAGFQKEVEIYDNLKESNISSHMLWHNRQKLIICTDRVRKIVTASSLNMENVSEIYDSLDVFHRLTQHIHRDIHPMNILTVDSKKIFFNDFASAVPFKTKQSIWGNSYFASERILCSNGEIEYLTSDDLYSLTFSLLFILNFQEFNSEFEKMRVINTQTILRKRNKLIQNLQDNSNVLNALKTAKKGDYKNTKHYILQYMQTLNNNRLIK